MGNRQGDKGDILELICLSLSVILRFLIKTEELKWRSKDILEVIQKDLVINWAKMEGTENEGVGESKDN